MSKDLEATLRAAGQAHLIPRLPAIAAQVADYDLDDWARWQAAVRAERAAPAGTLEPVESVPAVPADAAARAAAGAAAIRAGQVAAFVVAGGQGTRLGHDGPKGEVPCTPLSRRSLFEHFAAQLKATGARYGVTIPWYVMCSPLNQARTQAFFAEQGHFGLDPADVFFFAQGVLPTFDAAGRALLAGPERLLTNPDGHGGSLTALARSGALADMARRGITQIAYFQVDNPHTRIIDPLFLGLHLDPARSAGDFSSKMVVKTEASERVGVFGRIDGRYGIIEYSDLPPTLAQARRADGGLRFDAGNVAVHLIARAFVERLVAAGRARLPLHAAKKRCRVWDPARATVEPQIAIKLEQFVFDALAQTTRPLVWTVDRVEAFAPIKNRSGVDSAESSRALHIERAARWLEAAGVRIPRAADGAPDCVLEVRPETALCAADLRAVDLPAAVAPGASLLL